MSKHMRFCSGFNESSYIQDKQALFKELTHLYILPQRKTVDNIHTLLKYVYWWLNAGNFDSSSIRNFIFADNARKIVLDHRRYLAIDAIESSISDAKLWRRVYDALNYIVQCLIQNTPDKIEPYLERTSGI